jgi:hypothetical protein
MSITATACIRDDSLSDMPNCSIFAVMVIIAVVCPGGSASSVEIGNWNNASKYLSRIVAEIRRLVIRNPIYF